MQILRFLSVAIWLAVSAPASAADACAVILMHGKWGTPQSSYLRVLADKLRTVCVVDLQEMSWSRNRNYDSSYEETLQQLSRAVQAYRERGVRAVLLGGQSFGANAALAYAARIGGVDGLLALAPGHSPQLMFDAGLTRAPLERAQRLLEEGAPGSLVEFTDLNQGQRKSLQIRADVLVSYFDPQGLGNMRLSAQGFKQPIPLLWVIGTQDPLYRLGPAYVFDQVPARPENKYLVVDANHATTPEVASDAIRDWVQKLVQSIE